jgi:hypothetical protein
LLAKKKEKERKNVSLLPFPPIIKYWHIQYSYTRPIKKLPLKHINKLDLLISVNGQYRIKGFIQNMKGNRLFKIQAFSFASFILRKCALSLPHVPRPSSVCKALKRGSYSMDTPTRLYRQVLSLPKQTNSTTPKKSKKKKKNNNNTGKSEHGKKETRGTCIHLSLNVLTEKKKRRYQNMWTTPPPFWYRIIFSVNHYRKGESVSPLRLFCSTFCSWVGLSFSLFFVQELWASCGFGFARGFKAAFWDNHPTLRSGKGGQR